MLTASVVLYNTPRAQIYALFESVAASGCVRTLYVVDNSPSDRFRILEKEWAEKLNVRYIHNANLGARGSRRGKRLSRCAESGYPLWGGRAAVSCALDGFVSGRRICHAEGHVPGWITAISLQTSAFAVRFVFPPFSSQKRNLKKAE